jgi:NAD(P)-dependent dehydrogenase (short-subunit alcohol dehydrogenase family)
VFDQNRRSTVVKEKPMTSRRLKGRVALVAGATRAAGRGIALELGAAGATVYCTGRTTRTQASELQRLETIEETAELVQQAGGQGIAVQVDHLDELQVKALTARIEREQGRLDILVNDVWGADFLIEWNVPVWEHSLAGGLRMLRLAVDTHVITSHFALPLLIKQSGGLVVEMTNGTVGLSWIRWKSRGHRDYAIGIRHDGKERSPCTIC